MAEKTVPLDLTLILVWIQLPSPKTKKLTPIKKKIPPQILTPMAEKMFPLELTTTLICIKLTSHKHTATHNTKILSPPQMLTPKTKIFP